MFKPNAMKYIYILRLLSHFVKFAKYTKYILATRFPMEFICHMSIGIEALWHSLFPWWCENKMSH